MYKLLLLLFVLLHLLRQDDLSLITLIRKWAVVTLSEPIIQLGSEYRALISQMIENIFTSLYNLRQPADPPVLKQPTQTSPSPTLSELHFCISKLLSLWLEYSAELPQHCVYLKKYISHSSLLRSRLYKAEKSDSVFYIKPWMKLSLWGNYFGEKLL